MRPPLGRRLFAELLGLSRRHALAHIPAQIAGCMLAAVVANAMFAQALITISTKHRATPAHLFAEIIATLGLLLVIFSLARTRRGASVPGFILAQLAGGVVAIAVVRVLYPDITPQDAAEAVLPHADGRARAAAPAG